MTHTTCVYRDDVEIEVNVTYTIHPGSRGTREGMDGQVEPDEPDEVEIIDVEAGDGERFDLTDEEADAIVAEIWHAQDGL